MLFKKQVKEKDIQNYLRDQLVELPKCWSKKWSDRYLSNMPDYIVLHDGLIVFTELKKPSGQPRAGQEREGELIIEAGGIYTFLQSFDDVDQFVEGLKNGKLHSKTRTTNRR